MALKQCNVKNAITLLAIRLIDVHIAEHRLNLSGQYRRSRRNGTSGVQPGVPQVLRGESPVLFCRVQELNSRHCSFLGQSCSLSVFAIMLKQKGEALHGT